jgi:hypothetical protein
VSTFQNHSITGFLTTENEGNPTDTIEVVSGDATERNDLKPFRLESLDIIRGLAIALMIFTHFFYYSINPALIYNKLIFYVADLASYFSVLYSISQSGILLLFRSMKSAERVILIVN